MSTTPTTTAQDIIQQAFKIGGIMQPNGELVFNRVVLADLIKLKEFIDWLESKHVIKFDDANKVYMFDKFENNYVLMYQHRSEIHWGFQDFINKLINILK